MLHFLTESSESLPLIAGGAAAGGLTLAVVVIAAFVLYRRYTKRGKMG